jgi:hypothetical protein
LGRTGVLFPHYFWLVRLPKRYNMASRATALAICGNLVVALVAIVLLVLPVAEPANAQPQACLAINLGALWYGATTGYDPVMMNSWINQQWGVVFDCNGGPCDVSNCAVCININIYSGAGNNGPWMYESSGESTVNGVVCGAHYQYNLNYSVSNLPPGQWIKITYQYEAKTASGCPDDWDYVDVSHTTIVQASGGC